MSSAVSASSDASSGATMDANTLLDLLRQLDEATLKIQVYFAALCGIAFYEWLTNLPREVKYVWKAKWTPVKAIYLVIRYSGLLHAAIDLYAFFGPWSPAACTRFVTWIPAIPIVGVVGAHLILLIQCHAVWSRKNWIIYVLVPFVIAEVVIMSLSSFLHIDAVPIFTATGPCLPRAKSAFCIVYFALPMAFDLVVSALTAIKVLKLRNMDKGVGTGSALLNTIIQQSFQYFLFITTANLVNILYYAIDVNDPLSSLNGPLAIIATELFACRLTLSLRETKDHSETPKSFYRPNGRTAKGQTIVKVLMFGDQAHDSELTTFTRPVSIGAPFAAPTLPIPTKAPIVPTDQRI